ncbi:MAG TPA: PKD domain-containing protein [Thermoleophilaceae bacterium]|jgi:hypothetical protein
MSRLRLRAASIAALVVAASLALAGGAAAKTTPNFDFKAAGTAVQPTAAGADPNNDPTTHEDFPFKIADDDADGDISVHIEWLNPADDWDVYVYRKGPGGELITVGSGASAPPGDEENAVTQSQGVPITPGDYVIRVVNYGATDPTAFSGTARFGVFTPPNEIPVAKLSAPTLVQAGNVVRLDASASHDPDGSIVSYAFDLDGNGSMEVDNGNNPVLERTLGTGVHQVAVRVIDDKGLRAFDNATVVVQKKATAKHKKKKKKKKKKRKRR